MIRQTVYLLLAVLFAIGFIVSFALTVIAL